VKLAQDGELLCRGPIVMKGYRNKPAQTAEAIDGEGWLHTGDVGRFDDDGYLRIVDRKKELIISAAGKNMSPANIEATLKSSSALIGQACVIGDGRPYNVALVTLDPDAAEAFKTRAGLGAMSLPELAAHDITRAEIATAVSRANEQLARVEQVKTFTVLGVDWTPSSEELTPTMKLKRKAIAERYSAEIEGMYGG
jgi:long-subunit acyl-CoA synthetase (AMP-forming)